MFSYVYILHCADGTYYTGLTTDIDKRLTEHKDGKYFGSYTFDRRPVELVFNQEFMDIKIAIDFEKKIKKWSKAKKKALIERRYSDLHKLSKKKFNKTRNDESCQFE